MDDTLQSKVSQADVEFAWLTAGVISGYFSWG
jgi:hypothetical protein